MKRVAFIINPKSSHQEVANKIDKVKEKFPESLLFFSKDKISTYRFIRKVWEDIDIFVVVGGDGTVSSVASQLVYSDKKMAILPSGSGNGFAREMGFTQDIDVLYRKIQKSNVEKIDTFLLNEHFGVNAAGVGFDAFVAQKFENTQRGFWNYVRVCFRHYFSFTGVDIDVKSEKEKISGHFFFTTIANSRQFGNNAYIAPNAKLSDGLLDIVLVKKIPLWKSLEFVWKLFSGKITKNSYVENIQCHDLVIHTNTDIWHIDGDYLSICSPVKIKIQERSLNIIID